MKKTKHNSRPRVIVIAGPTGAGKTAAAVSIVPSFGEIINADSRQIFKHMRIGTAQPSPEELQVVPHHLFGFLSPKKKFNAYDYARRARKIIFRLHRRGKITFLVGGTGFYIRAALDGLNAVPGNNAVRRRIEARCECEGLPALYEYLATVDPPAAQRIHRNDKMRIVRALEIYETSGKTQTELFSSRVNQTEYDTLYIALTRNREELYENINKRVIAMLDNGWLDETKRLLKRGVQRDMLSLQSVGYCAIINYILGNAQYVELVRQIQQETRNYAKRQLTWFRNDKRYKWHDARDLSGIREEILSWIGKNKYITRENANGNTRKR